MRSVSLIKYGSCFALLFAVVLNINCFSLDREGAASQNRQKLSADDEQLLEDLEKSAFHFFWDQANPQTGLVLDRARNDGKPNDEKHLNIASIAATGFGLSAICVAQQRQWITRQQASTRVLVTLRFFARTAYQNHG